MSDQQQHIEALLSEHRVFPPPAGFAEGAVVADDGLYARAHADHQAFWAEQAATLAWSQPWDTVMDWNPPWVTWFAGGKLNAAYNCLDRHVEAGGGDKVAFYWEGEPGDTKVITYRELLDDVARLANALKSLGVAKGDRVNIYLGMVPELPIAMLASRDTARDVSPEPWAAQRTPAPRGIPLDAWLTAPPASTRPTSSASASSPRRPAARRDASP